MRSRTTREVCGSGAVGGVGSSKGGRGGRGEGEGETSEGERKREAHLFAARWVFGGESRSRAQKTKRTITQCHCFDFARRRARVRCSAHVNLHGSGPGAPGGPTGEFNVVGIGLIDGTKENCKLVALFHFLEKKKHLRIR